MNNKKGFLITIEFKVLILIIGLLTTKSFDVSGATYYTASSGKIHENIWSTATNGAAGGLPTLAANDIIYIDDNIEISTNFQTWQNVPLTIYLNATIEISGQWNLHVNTVVHFQTSSAKVLATGPGNSEKIKFGNSNTWTGDDGDLTGPGALDKNYDPDTSPLPIQLLFFRANVDEKKVFLEWSTASELNFDYFVVERSSNGKDFTEIFQVKGHGTTNERNDYSAQDDRPLIGKNYYRLKSVDYDGYTEYFNLVVADYSADRAFFISPNPSDGLTINFLLNFSPDENAMVTIFDNWGTIVGSATPSQNQGSITFFNPLRSGLYYAKLTSNNFTSVEKFVVR